MKFTVATVGTVLASSATAATTAESFPNLAGTSLRNTVADLPRSARSHHRGLTGSTQDKHDVRAVLKERRASKKQNGGIVRHLRDKLKRSKLRNPPQAQEDGGDTFDANMDLGLLVSRNLEPEEVSAVGMLIDSCPSDYYYRGTGFSCSCSNDKTNYYGIGMVTCELPNIADAAAAESREKSVVETMIENCPTGMQYDLPGIHCSCFIGGEYYATAVPGGGGGDDQYGPSITCIAADEPEESSAIEAMVESCSSDNQLSGPGVSCTCSSVDADAYTGSITCTYDEVCNTPIENVCGDYATVCFEQTYKIKILSPRANSFSNCYQMKWGTMEPFNYCYGDSYDNNEDGGKAKCVFEIDGIQCNVCEFIPSLNETIVYKAFDCSNVDYVIGNGVLRGDEALLMRKLDNYLNFGPLPCEGGCNLCPEGETMMNLNNKVTLTTGEEYYCYALNVAAGVGDPLDIPGDLCTVLPAQVNEPCGCTARVPGASTPVVDIISEEDPIAFERSGSPFETPVEVAEDVADQAPTAGISEEAPIATETNEDPVETPVDVAEDVADQDTSVVDPISEEDPIATETNEDPVETPVDVAEDVADQDTPVADPVSEEDPIATETNEDPVETPVDVAEDVADQGTSVVDPVSEEDPIATETNKDSVETPVDAAEDVADQATPVVDPIAEEAPVATETDEDPVEDPIEVAEGASDQATPVADSIAEEAPIATETDEDPFESAAACSGIDGIAVAAAVASIFLWMV